jgi:hypothetical protein
MREAKVASESTHKWLSARWRLNSSSPLLLSIVISSSLESPHDKKEVDTTMDTLLRISARTFVKSTSGSGSIRTYSNLGESWFW